MSEITGGCACGTVRFAIDGPLGLVEEGDIIAIDAGARSIALNVAEEELAARRARRGTPKLQPLAGWLGLYRDNVGPLTEGGIVGRRKRP